MDLLTHFFSVDFLGKPAWLWLAFVGIVVALLAFDLGVLRSTTARNAAASGWTAANSTS